MTIKNLPNKKAVELSVNFLVVVILSIIVFGMGFVFVTRIFSGVGDIPDKLSQKSEAELARLLFSGERTAIYPGEITIPRGKSDVFGLGILNIDPSNTKINFRVNPKIVTGVDANNNPVSADFDVKMVDYTYAIKNNENRKLLISVKTPNNALKGTYVMDIYICRSDDPNTFPSEAMCDQPTDILYGGMLKAYVKVP